MNTKSVNNLRLQIKNSFGCLMLYHLMRHPPRSAPRNVFQWMFKLLYFMFGDNFYELMRWRRWAHFSLIYWGLMLAREQKILSHAKGLDLVRSEPDNMRWCLSSALTKSPTGVRPQAHLQSRVFFIQTVIIYRQNASYCTLDISFYFLFCWMFTLFKGYR